MSVSINGTGGITFADASTQSTGGYTGFRNRIINGDMRIDQRNAGAAVTAEAYTVDRWRTWRQNTYSIQQVADAPSEFAYSLKVTKTDALQSAYGFLIQNIEGFNSADFMFGTASAKALTLSFWVKASITGSWVAWVQNAAATRSFPVTYTINTANTWEYKSVQITGDTTGAWAGATNSTGMVVLFNFGQAAGTATVGVWNTMDHAMPAGTVGMGTTNGATFYITGVQLEKGSVATPFEFRPYGTELALCQRYCQVIRGAAYTKFGSGVVGSGNTAWAITCTTKTTMRSTPTISQSNCSVTDASNNYTVTGLNNLSSADSISFDATIGTASLTAGRAVLFGDAGGANAVLTASAEL